MVIYFHKIMTKFYKFKFFVSNKNYSLIEKNVKISIYFLIFIGNSVAGSVAGSKHDLSSAGTGDSSQVCVFCHTPHWANNNMSTLNAPLWNRFLDPSKVYMVYSSPTLNTNPGNPAITVSALCLGCHDGTFSRVVVYGNSGLTNHRLINSPGFLQNNATPNCTRCHAPRSAGTGLWPTLQMGLDLSNMHPLSMSYPTSGEDAKFNPPPDAQRGWPNLPLFGGKIECSTCHSVHDPTITPFLRVSNGGSALCLMCHIK